MKTLFANELRMLLRDTRTLLITVVAPIVIFPVLIFVLNAVENREAERLDTATYEFAVHGDATAWGRPLLDQALARIEQDTASRAVFRETEVDGDTLAVLEDRVFDADGPGIVEIEARDGARGR